jgi:hypothetical protein
MGHHFFKGFVFPVNGFFRKIFFSFGPVNDCQVFAELLPDLNITLRMAVRPGSSAILPLSPCILKFQGMDSLSSMVDSYFMDLMTVMGMEEFRHFLSVLLPRRNLVGQFTFDFMSYERESNTQGCRALSCQIAKTFAQAANAGILIKPAIGYKCCNRLFFTELFR